MYVHYYDDVSADLLGMDQEMYDNFDHVLPCDLDGNDLGSSAAAVQDHVGHAPNNQNSPQPGPSQQDISVRSVDSDNRSTVAPRSVNNL